MYGLTGIAPAPAFGCCIDFAPSAIILIASDKVELMFELVEEEVLSDDEEEEEVFVLVLLLLFCKDNCSICSNERRKSDKVDSAYNGENIHSNIYNTHYNNHVNKPWSQEKKRGRNENDGLQTQNKTMKRTIDIVNTFTIYIFGVW